ncbi:exodeoxyribonuclease VII large subunit [Mycoavidus sp. SF9855]|uniref:exodeoxyribonuclease VII large subunit n=1 Tax=Mycoavidus sp. SF9855 TaxID=2968475 RepID=UPI00211D0F2F|nr:exodeoxyribonuclease VII large subunit [Mycoavidus sp. SF9855]UUM21436.1 exodeoxyribonuclease VII large subunit [Mycoavidus sp. SF9855]
MEIKSSWPVSNGGETVLSVSALNGAISTALERTFPLIWVAGEVSNFTCAASGHWYFSLKDSAAQIRCVMFRMRAQSMSFVPANGDRIEVRALVTVYEPRGEVQLKIESIRRTGQGQLYEAFLQLKQKLESAGLFAASRKRELPSYPRTIGIVTSLQAAALQDVLTTLRRRAPHLSVIVYPSPVQGVEAAAKLAKMIECANQRAEVELLIICRGGGSLEDLWAFNEETLARAIAASHLPIVSGVGHETDFTIADFVADQRAPTPTGAAELVSPAREMLLRELEQSRRQLMRACARLVEGRAQQLDWLARGLLNPAERLRRQQSQLQQQATRLAMAFAQPHAQRCATLREAAAKLELLSPQRTLERGYAALLDPRSQHAIRSPAILAKMSQIVVHLAQGSADVELTRVQLRSEVAF